MSSFDPSGATIMFSRRELFALSAAGAAMVGSRAKAATNYGHYVENVCATDLAFVGVFRAPCYDEVSLSNWLAHTAEARRPAPQYRRTVDRQNSRATPPGICTSQ
jgi:hypothetical protein